PQPRGACWRQRQRARNRRGVGADTADATRSLVGREVWGRHRRGAGGHRPVMTAGNGEPMARTEAMTIPAAAEPELMRRAPHGWSPGAIATWLHGEYGVQIRPR